MFEEFLAYPPLRAIKLQKLDLQVTNWMLNFSFLLAISLRYLFSPKGQGTF